MPDTTNRLIPTSDVTRFTLHVAGPRDLARLGRTMNNCLTTYGRGRTSGPHRIIEVREGTRTRYAVHVHNGRITMFEAPDNRPPDRHDVPVIRHLLREQGILDQTRTTPPPDQQGQRRRRADLDRRRGGRDRRARTTTPSGVSVQALAAELLRPYSLGTPEWPELAAALWATGLLPVLPDPSQDHYRQLILDLAERLATGQNIDLPRRPPPSSADRQAARDRLLTDASPRTLAGWHRHRMAQILTTELRP